MGKAEKPVWTAAQSYCRHGPGGQRCAIGILEGIGCTHRTETLGVNPSLCGWERKEISLHNRQGSGCLAGGRAHLGLLPMDVNVAPIGTGTHSTGHHVVQLEENAVQYVCWGRAPSPRPRSSPDHPRHTFCRMRFRQTLSSQSMSGSPRPGSFLESLRYTSTSTSGSASACGTGHM